MDQYLPVGVRNNKMDRTLNDQDDGWFDKNLTAGKVETIKHKKGKLQQRNHTQYMNSTQHVFPSLRGGQGNLLVGTGVAKDEDEGQSQGKMS